MSMLIQFHTSSNNAYLPLPPRQLTDIGGRSLCLPSRWAPWSWKSWLNGLKGSKGSGTAGQVSVNVGFRGDHREIIRGSGCHGVYGSDRGRFPRIENRTDPRNDSRSVFAVIVIGLPCAFSNPRHY